MLLCMKDKKHLTVFIERFISKTIFIVNEIMKDNKLIPECKFCAVHPGSCVYEQIRSTSGYLKFLQNGAGEQYD